MKKLWYYLVHTYVRLGLHLYFRKIIVQGKENIPTRGPVMFLANHQNALLDALLVATTNNRHTHFLARADLFKNSMIRLLLSTINMKPVYRIRDGWSTLALNSLSFDYCEAVLNSGDGLLLFPEGNHDLRRRLRPLSKGFTRIIDHAMKSNPSLDLNIVPIGINYSSHQQVWSSVSIYYGDPIRLREFIDLNDIKSLRDEMSRQMKKLITHIEDGHHYELWNQFLLEQNADYLNPHKTNRLLETATLPASGTSVAKGASENLSHFLPIIFHFVPGMIWLMIKRRIKDPVFVPTFRFAVAVSLFPINFLIQCLWLWTISPTYSIAFGTMAILSLPAYGYFQRKR